MDTTFKPNVKEFELEVDEFLLEDVEREEWIGVTFLVRWDETNERFYPIRAYYDDHMLDLETKNLAVNLFLWQWEADNLSEYAWNEYQKRYV